MSNTPRFRERLPSSLIEGATVNPTMRKLLAWTRMIATVCSVIAVS